ncbi:hypothetical protein VPH35_132202 [Triticum aestivum]
MPQPPELAAVVSRANFDLGTLGSDSPPRSLYVDCWNDLLLLTSFVDTSEPKRIVRCPLYPERCMTILPPVPDTSLQDGFTYYEREIILNGGGDGLSFIYLALASTPSQTVVHVYVLQVDIWAIYFSAVSELTSISLQFPSLISDGKIYNLASVCEIVEKLFMLDLVSFSFSLVDLPEEDFQIRIWLHTMDSNRVANWSLVNTICLREICDSHMIPIHMFEDLDDYFLEVHAVGFNSEFVFIETDDNVLYLFDIKSKALKKVHEITEEDDCVYSVSPFMMIWPPKFPVMKEGCDLLKE